MKKVQVTMPDNEHAALKDYCSAFDVTMSEVMYEAAKLYMHKHSGKCGHIKGILRFRKLKVDKRLIKECWGEDCLTCTRQIECRTGIYTGTWEKDKKYETLNCYSPPSSGEVN